MMFHLCNSMSQATRELAISRVPLIGYSSDQENRQTNTEATVAVETLYRIDS